MTRHFRENPISIALILERLRYNPRSGDFVWLSGQRAGMVAGCVTAQGYRQIKIGKSFFLAHRLVWLVVHGRLPEVMIDHCDGNRLNNRLENLRECSYGENGRNSKRYQNNKSGFKGVSAPARMNKFKAQITVGRQARHLGYFDTKEQAHDAYLRAATAANPDFVRGE